MEFPQLERHCHLKSCQKIDFCPFQCELCKFSFCTNHRTYASHQCSSISELKDKKAVECPICSTVVTVLPNENADNKVWAHINDNCGASKAKEMQSRTCSYSKCNKIEKHPIRCDRCSALFCIAHRLSFDHGCTAIKSFRQSPKVH